MSTKMECQDLEKRWAKYDAVSNDELDPRYLHLGNLLYRRGDVIDVLDKPTEHWAIGCCRGFLGLFPLEQTVPGPFVMALSDYTARNDREISFRKGEVMAAAPSQHQAGYTVFNQAEYGECSEALFTTMDYRPSVEEFRQEPQKYYQYSNLQPGQIRLVYITAADVEQFVACGRQSLFVTIHHTSLENVNEATALSYCWSDPTDKKPIFANGKLLYIPSTLWRAIRWNYPKSGLDTYALADHIDDVGPPKQPAVFWADAICINQENSLEKNHQIPLMGSIYSSARDVLVYVGETEQLAAILDMKIIAETAEQFAPWTIVPDKVIREKMSRMDWNDVCKFLSQQVFRRSWVTQEIVLATNLKISYGKTEINLNQILDCIKAIRMNHVRHVDSLLGVPAWTRDQSQEFRHAIIQLYNLANIKSRHLEGVSVNFIEILESFRHTKATDPRDKVYSLLSLASETYRNSIVPNYYPSNTVTSVFLHLARIAITIGDIEPLLRNAEGPQTVSGLPSWVPDWTQDSRSLLPSDQYTCGGDKRTCQASLSSTSSQIQLTIRGTLFSKIMWKGPTPGWTGYGDFPDIYGTLSIGILFVYHLLRMGSKVVGALGGTYFNGDDLLTAVWKTIVCDLGWNNERTQDSDKRHFEAFLTCYQDQLLELFASEGRRVSVSMGTRLAHSEAELMLMLEITETTR
jgi:hypothetical protein